MSGGGIKLEDRFRQLQELEVLVYRGSVYDTGIPLPICALSLTYEDGREHVYHFGRHEVESLWRSGSGPRAYPPMDKIFTAEGLKIPKDQLSIEPDLHTLEFRNGDLYQFLMPCVKYFPKLNHVK